jgi:hypothetical protein
MKSPMVQGVNPLSETAKPVGVGLARRYELLNLAVVDFSPLEEVFKYHRRMTHDKAELIVQFGSSRGALK